MAPLAVITRLATAFTLALFIVPSHERRKKEVPSFDIMSIRKDLTMLFHLWGVVGGGILTMWLIYFKIYKLS